MSDIVHAADRLAHTGGGAVTAVRRIAITLPSRVAAECDGDVVTYRQLHSTIIAYRLVTGAEGLDDDAAVCAALVHCLPGLSAISDPIQLGERLASLVDGMIGDTAA